MLLFMQVAPIHTPVVTAGALSLPELLDTVLTDFSENSILVVTSKVVSLCESRVAEIDGADKMALIKRESQYFLDPAQTSHGYHFSVVHGMLTSSAGIDASNSGGKYVLWPLDPQKSANQIRQYLTRRFAIKHAGVLIVDSMSQPLRRGSVGVALAHSGFKALNDYRGKLDLFERPMKVSVANITSGLAAAAVVSMGEGAEGTPLAVIADVPFVTFQTADPSADELAELHTTLEDDYFGSFFKVAPWQRGDQN
jgi:F420-0:gamma-glutamyl ligase